ncbi:MAG: hypothetical protein ASUL_07029 [Candidatus Aramenus sulfurataquae]|jgi:hypothetical protein|uniref:SirA family protein n=2 Tax=Candidatus Aramenus sulfurataquae TaxID=1326980 RepID=W7KWA1_9CREN|nr:MAG: hypothetical protein ASUL_07029 [Candidatus Aramenus sulfurataquae]MCL7343601.1 hypothetical protein [Candidatus Aramenus sulfurataquae]
MERVVDLDSSTCSSEPLEALGFLLRKKGVVFSISLDNPYYQEIKRKYEIEIVKKEGDKVYFLILSGG